MALTDDAHCLIKEHFKDKAKGLAVDATCGNGFDSQFLCGLGFEQLIGFDIQAQAISATRQRLVERKYTQFKLIEASHELLENYISSSIDCIMFNFGYLPNGNKRVTTEASSSIKALRSACRLLSKHGVISLICYPGHASGAIEAQAILTDVKALDSAWQVDTHLAASPKPTAPILYIVKRSA